MSKFHNDDTYATLPGRLSLDLERLRVVSPHLFTERTFKCSPTCDKDHPAAEMRERLAEALSLGCASTAVVVQLHPLLISVYACDLDAAVLLRFPNRVAEHFGLRAGQRLIAVNTFWDMKTDAGEQLYASDLLPGPERTNWSGPAPLIGELLSDDVERINALHAQFDEGDWERLRVRTRERLSGMWRRPRDGRPPYSAMPDGWFKTPDFVPLSRVPARFNPLGLVRALLPAALNDLNLRGMAWLAAGLAALFGWGLIRAARP